MLKINSANYMVTTSTKLSCHKCKEKLEGDGGFIKLDFYKKGEFNSSTNMYLCHNCLKPIVRRYLRRKGLYEALVKRLVIRKLKDAK